MADPNTRLPLTRQSVLEAHELIKPHIHFTPVLTNRTIDQIASTPQTVEALKGTEWEGREPAKPKVRLWFKCENLQRVGAFKVRGAFHALKRLEEEEGRKVGKDGKEVGFQEGGWRQKGVVTHSSGNHAQALALAAREFAIPAHIVMPTISTPSKIAATKGYGAHVRFSGDYGVGVAGAGEGVAEGKEGEKEVGGEEEEKEEEREKEKEKEKRSKFNHRPLWWWWHVIRYSALLLLNGDCRLSAPNPRLKVQTMAAEVSNKVPESKASRVLRLQMDCVPRWARFLGVSFMKGAWSKICF
ncbi:hypothetical protein DID88_001933 [Monilinia fructigena]|uniref:Tryptophan synthase beta chain-like PALP domain-containing protein n=1 Tax=Monilinia fructigena TaxID=38457 RepID=A0A395IVZ1_9HELO|nr:hypothetical protein DID88_001933 [Monilinia fructigena]